MKKYDEVIALWQSYQIKTASDLDKYLESFRILFAYHSGKIENDSITFHDTRGIFKNGKVIGFTGDPRSLFEQQNQKLCYEVLKEKIICKEALSIELVKEIHRILAGGTYDAYKYVDRRERPGEFKRHDYVVAYHEVGSAAEDVAKDLEELINEVNESGKKDPLRAAAYLHARFEFIHPFADGNGGVGRTLMNYWLMINDHPPLIIYEEDRNTYYQSLQKYDGDEDLVPLFEFFKEETVKTWKRALDMSQGVQKERKGIDCFM